MNMQALNQRAAADLLMGLVALIVLITLFWLTKPSNISCESESRDCIQVDEEKR